MIGLVWPRASTVNSLETQARVNDEKAYPPVGSLPSSPNRWGSTAVRPAPATDRPNSATWGVIPGISLITITAGPDPVR